MTSGRSGVPAGITVSAPARLHLGFLDLNGNLGRRFGSIGLAIDGLRFRVTLRAAAHTEVTGADRERARQYLESMQRWLGIEDAFHLTVDEAIPPHIGLGSGTQLALAVAAAVRRACDLPLDLCGDAMQLGRGARSGIGIGLFERGGLVVDGGRGPSTRPAPVITHMPFPEQWRVIVVLDPHLQGLHGAAESEAFARMPPFPAEVADRLCRLVLMGVLPAVAEADLIAFGAAISEIQARLGDYFAPLQGGSRFLSPDVAAALHLMERNGAIGIGQSSWGPTGFAFAPSRDEAERLAAAARHHLTGRALDIRVCRALNRGSDLEVRSHLDQARGLVDGN